MAEKIIPRKIEKDIFKWIYAKEILVIRGPRQCGKTTLLYRIIEKLKMKVSKENIHLITFEDEIEKSKFEKDPKEYMEFYIKDKKKHYFLFDEIQYVKKAGKILKLLYDTNPNIKFIITGSSTLDLNEVGSYLVGRSLFFELRVFSFEEFLETKDEKLLRYYQKNKFDLNKPKEVKTLFIDKLKNYLKEYITFGGYPRVVLENNNENKKFLLKNIFSTYIEKDLVKLYGIKYKKNIMDLVSYLVSINGMMINYNEAAEIANLYFKELKELLHILEDTFVIKLISPFYKNLVSEIKKNPKIYFIDTGLRNVIANRFDFSEQEYGILLENYILGKFPEDKVSYWRTTAKAEVDFIINNIPIEVKINPKLTRSFRSFINEYNPKYAVMVNMKSSEKLKIKKCNIFLVPFVLM